MRHLELRSGMTLRSRIFSAWKAWMQAQELLFQKSSSK
jgi:hypothetical protein